MMPEGAQRLLPWLPISPAIGAGVGFWDELVHDVVHQGVFGINKVVKDVLQGPRKDLRV